MAKILVTGGSGFIGTNLVQSLLSSRSDVLSIDLKPPQIDAHLDSWKFGDVNDLNSLLDLSLDFMPDYIVHLAARTDLKGSSLDDYTTNVDGVSNIVFVAKQIKSLKKIVVASSMLVCRSGYHPSGSFDYNPSTVYGQSKVITERIVWESEMDCDWAIIRPTSIWGPWFNEPYRAFFDKVIDMKYFHIGNKSATKTYGYVGNSVHQIVKILFSTTTNSSNKIFYIGDDPAINIEDWANEIAKELNQKIIRLPFILIKFLSYLGDILNHFNIDFPLTSFRLNNMTTNNVVDLSKTQKVVKKNRFNRQEGIKITLEWIERSKNTPRKS